jgi:hypothetical protein
MSLRDTPDAVSLIVECRRVLKDKLIPEATGVARYQMLMVISALGMAERELTESASLDAALSAPAALAGGDTATLVAAIRAGRHDADSTLHAALVNASAARVAISKPQSTKTSSPTES